MDKEAALAMVIGVSFTAIFAGDIPATFLRIPGTPASAAATLDAHELAKKGYGRQALLVNLLCSALGGVGGVILLIYISPALAEVAVGFWSVRLFLALPTRSDIGCFRLKWKASYSGIARSVTGLSIRYDRA